MQREKERDREREKALSRLGSLRVCGPPDLRG